MEEYTCSVFGVDTEGCYTNQCLNGTNEACDKDIQDAVNKQWKDKGMMQAMTGPAICEMHMRQLEDI